MVLEFMGCVEDDKLSWYCLVYVLKKLKIILGYPVDNFLNYHDLMTGWPTRSLVCVIAMPFGVG